MKRVVTLDRAIVFDEYFSVKFVRKYLPKFTSRRQKVDNATGYISIHWIAQFLFLIHLYSDLSGG